LGTDETPAPLTEAASNEADCHNPHVYTVRTMGAYTGGGADLVWYGAAGNRTKASITAFGILDDIRGVLVRDDFGGYLSYDAELAGVQQCLAHVLRYLDDAHAIDTDAQAWARQVADVLHVAIHEVNTVRAADRTAVDAELLGRLRRRFDRGVVAGISTGRPVRGRTGLQLVDCRVGLAICGGLMDQGGGIGRLISHVPASCGIGDLSGVGWLGVGALRLGVRPAWR